MFRKLLDEGQAGDNVGCLLRGVKREDVERGQVLAKPGSITPHTKFEAEVYVLTKEEGGRHTPFFNGYRPQFYFRTTDVTGVATLPEGTEMVMPGDNVRADGGADHADRDGGGAAVRDPRRRPHRRRRRRRQDPGVKGRADARPDFVPVRAVQAAQLHRRPRTRRRRTEKLALRKFCPSCRAHTVHKESRSDERRTRHGTSGRAPDGEVSGQ